LWSYVYNFSADKQTRRGSSYSDESVKQGLSLLTDGPDHSQEYLELLFSLHLYNSRVNIKRGISGFDGGEFEDDSFLGCRAV
jgi:hypothetical protein